MLRLAIVLCTLASTAHGLPLYEQRYDVSTEQVVGSLTVNAPNCVADLEITANLDGVLTQISSIMYSVGQPVIPFYFVEQPDASLDVHVFWTTPERELVFSARPAVTEPSLAALLLALAGISAAKTSRSGRLKD